jgi:hypothetical protein
MIKRVRDTKTTSDQSRKIWLKKFLYYFRKGFADPKYVSWEREYKETAQKKFQEQLNKTAFKKLLKNGEYKTIADLAVKIEREQIFYFHLKKWLCVMP